jgi:hypothetical protein
MLIADFLHGMHRFSIPPPSTTTIDVTVGARHFFFLQDDFHTSFSGFLATLPPELQLSRAATEMNRWVSWFGFVVCDSILCLLRPEVSCGAGPGW